jgi:N4-(beta-N-acetylglucosaminyl)-L-asparaginase
MHGPKRRAGAVAALEGVRTPSLVAKAVMEHTDHHLLVGKGAQDFARSLGMKVEADLNTPRSRELWLEWKRRSDPDHYLDPRRRQAAALEAGLSMVRDGLIPEGSFWGTINCNAVGPTGDVCGATSTSGTAWKIPGRSGDSPIIGAGVYVDNEVGAAGSTGRGEANLYNLTPFLIVEEMRRGRHPKDAAMAGLARIRAATVEKRLLDAKGQPRFNVSFYVVDRQGRTAGATMFHKTPTAVAQWAICTEHGAELRETESLFEAMAGV